MRYLIVLICLSLSSFAFGQKTDTVDTRIVFSVDRLPEFKGGSATWQQFLSRTIDLNRTLEEMDSTQYVDFGVRQTAILEFTVCEDGLVCDIKVLNKDKISPAFAAEAVRVMKKSPKWQPAMKDNKPVRTRFRQNIVAVLED